MLFLERVISLAFAIQIRKCLTRKMSGSQAWPRHYRSSAIEYGRSIGNSTGSPGGRAANYACSAGPEPAQFQLAHAAYFRRHRTTRAAVVVGVFHDYCDHYNVSPF